jgi:hypothetical protein
MNILLIYPEFPDTFWSFKYALPFVRKRAAFPPFSGSTVMLILTMIIKTLSFIRQDPDVRHTC